MKKTLLTLAAVLALSGSAFAANNISHAVKHPTAATCVDTKTNVKLDCASTGSVAKKASAEATTDGKGPRLGITVNPWIMPSAY
ncbi:DUF680 domain-containing protein [Mesorhizobium sp. Cs1299R1N1]|uniref:DUF680 domain-containing protein n=1 Tax=Mesorhizobium sp. Cs1299R1N1 TaxID=3015172 RepID=UPI00301BD531